MTPMQKLVRLAQIERELAELPTKPHAGLAALDAAKHQLNKERRDLLASVGNPPPELINSTDGHAWATAFVETVQGVELEQAFGWFSAALIAGHDVGRQVGHEEAIENATRQQGEAVEKLAGLLRQIRQLTLSGAIHSKRLSIGRTTMALPDLIESTLLQTGQPHE